MKRPRVQPLGLGEEHRSKKYARSTTITATYKASRARWDLIIEAIRLVFVSIRWRFMATEAQPRACGGPAILGLMEVCASKFHVLVERRANFLPAPLAAPSAAGSWLPQYFPKMGGDVAYQKFDLPDAALLPGIILGVAAMWTTGGRGSTPAAATTSSPCIFFESCAMTR